MKTVEDNEFNGLDDIKINVPRDQQNEPQMVQIQFTPQKRPITSKAIKDAMNFQLDNLGASVKTIIIEDLDKSKKV